MRALGSFLLYGAVAGEIFASLVSFSAREGSGVFSTSFDVQSQSDPEQKCFSAREGSGVFSTCWEVLLWSTDLLSFSAREGSGVFSTINRLCERINMGGK